MRKVTPCTIVLFFTIFTVCAQESFVGTWKTIDDTDKVEKSYVEIFEKEGKLYGRVSKLLSGATLTHCTACSGDKKDQPITGMEILWGLEKEANYYDDGTILDPATGKEYSCSLELEGEDILKVRGYLGFSWLGRTQYWYRVQ